MTTSPLEKVVHLNRYHHFTQLMRDPSIEGQLQRFKSEHDGTKQTVLVLEPADQKPANLFFFFHGMDGDCGDGVVARDIVKRLRSTVITMGGRGPAWVSTEFLADAEQVIRQYQNGFQDFYLIGVSMGGTQVLALAGLLPDDLRQSVAGVIALIPGANLPALLARSSNERVRNTVRESVQGNSSLLEQRSPMQVMSQYKARLPFVIFHNQSDTLLLTDELAAFVTGLRSKGHPVTTYSAPGDHNFTYENFDFQEAIGKLGTDSTQLSVPLITAGP